MKSTHRKCLSFIGLANLLVFAAAHSQAPTNLVPGHGESILNVGGARHFELSHNAISAVAQEIDAPGFRKLLAKILEVPEPVILKHRYGIKSNFQVQVSTAGLSITNAELLAQLLKAYTLDRATGHTAAYAVDSLKVRLNQTTPEPDGWRANLFRAFPYLPREWVKDHPFEETVLTNAKGPLVKQFVVIDGAIAWEYLIYASAERGSVIRVDARELDPAIRSKLEVARGIVHYQSPFPPGSIIYQISETKQWSVGTNFNRDDWIRLKEAARVIQDSSEQAVIVALTEYCRTGCSTP